MRKKLPDGVDLLDKIPARDKGAKEGDARAEAEYCGAIDKVRRWSAHGGKGLGKGRLVACLNRPARAPAAAQGSGRQTLGENSYIGFSPSHKSPMNRGG